MLNGQGGEQGCKYKTEETPLMPTVFDGAGALSNPTHPPLHSLIREPGLLFPVCISFKVLDSLLDRTLPVGITQPMEVLTVYI